MKKIGFARSAEIAYILIIMDLFINTEESNYQEISRYQNTR